MTGGLSYVQATTAALLTGGTPAMGALAGFVVGDRRARALSHAAADRGGMSAHAERGVTPTEVAVLDSPLPCEQDVEKALGRDLVAERDTRARIFGACAMFSFAGGRQASRRSVQDRCRRGPIIVSPQQREAIEGPPATGEDRDDRAFLDGWERDLLFRCSPQQISVRSGGLDGRFHTPDEVVGQCPW